MAPVVELISNTEVSSSEYVSVANAAPSSGSSAATVPTAACAPLFSSMLSVLGAVLGNAGASFRSVTLIVTWWVAVNAGVALSVAVTVTV